MNNAIFVICLLSSILVIGLKAVPIEEPSKNELMVKKKIAVKCEIENGEQLTCEKCVEKGTNCFWCVSTQKCMPYQWNFPNCQLKYVRKNNCWVDWFAVVILGMTLVAIVISAICYCFIHFCMICIDYYQQIQHAGEMLRLKKATERRIAMQYQNQQRRMERKIIKDNIKKKYGIPLTSPAFEKFK
uniref:PSI domain-containing protein n=1 Tax=Wuchereria bancrofti TaxID=6293 RepID=A0AAF5Q1G0_WUCBA